MVPSLCLSLSRTRTPLEPCSSSVEFLHSPLPSPVQLGVWIKNLETGERFLKRPLACRKRRCKAQWKALLNELCQAVTPAGDVHGCSNCGRPTGGPGRTGTFRRSVPSPLSFVQDSLRTEQGLGRGPTSDISSLLAVVQPGRNSHSTEHRAEIRQRSEVAPLAAATTG